MFGSQPRPGPVQHSHEGVVSPKRELPFREQVLRLIDNGLPMDSDTIGFHGTGSVAIAALMATGLLPTPKAGHIIKGFLYFVPRREAFAQHPEIHNFESDNDALLHAEGYAHANASLQYVAQRLGLDLSEVVHKAVASELSERSAGTVDAQVAKMINQLGMSAADQKTLQRDAQLCRGVVVGVHRSVLERFEVSDGDYTRSGTRKPSHGTPADLRVHAPGGFPIELISGIRVLGERDFFTRLKSDVAAEFLPK